MNLPITGSDKTKRATFMTGMGIVQQLTKPKDENSREKLILSSKITLEEEEVPEVKKETVEKKWETN